MNYQLPRNSFNNRRGMVSVFVLLLSGFYLTMGLTLLALHMGAFQDTQNTLDANQLRYMAQSAVQEARHFAANIDPAWSGTSAEFTFGPTGKPIGTYKYTITQTGNLYDITGNAYIPNSTSVKKTSDSINIKMRNPSPSIIFSDGFESGNLSNWTAANDSNANWSISSTNSKNGAKNAYAYRPSGGGTKKPTLTTATYNLSGYDLMVLRFSWRADPDGSVITVYQDSGAGWVSIYSDSSNSYNSAYIRPAVRINLTNLTSTVKFRFEASLKANDGYRLDDVQLSTPYAVYDSTVD